MTQQFRFTDDDGEPLVDFRGGDFYRPDAWSTRGPLPGELIVSETIPLVKMADKDDIRRDITNLETVLADAAQQVQDEMKAGWTWFEWMTKGEEDKRALVYGGNVELPGKRGMSANLYGDIVGPVLRFQRHRFYENMTADTIISLNMSLLGSKRELTGEGTADSRIATLLLTPDDVAGGAVTRIWAGIREVGAGVDEFQPLWEFEDGGYGYTGSESNLVNPDANASGGQSIEVTFGTLNSEASRARIAMSQLSGITEYSHFVGRYLVLLRWSASSGAKISIRASTSIGSVNPIYLNSKQYIDGAGTSTYNILPLGIVNIPFLGNKTSWTATQISKQLIEIHAACITGTAGVSKLRLDDLVLIPANRSLTITNGNIQNSTSQTVIKTLPTDKTKAWYKTIGSGELPLGIVDAAAVNFTIPREGGVMVIAGARAASSNVDDTIGASLEVYRRWQTYRRGEVASW